MRRTSGMKSVLFLYVIFALLLIGALLAAAIYLTYITTITRPDGQASRSDWPQQYAESFERYISVNDGVPEISADVLSSLERNELWVQILDGEGNQITEHNKPSEVPVRYSVSDLLGMAASGRLNEYTVAIISLTDNKQSFEYIIGFPVGITKTTMYFNSDRFTAGRTVIFIALAGLCVVLLVAGLFYGIWLTKHLTKITKSASAIATRNYTPERSGGVFGDAYKSLNDLNSEIRLSDEIRINTDRIREEWITNITHDLKTPLSPIKGYAELLIDAEYSATPEEIKKYGQIILKNAAYTEQLISDLKLTYQLESSVMPVKMEAVNIAREIKEIVIDIANNPEYTGKTIQYQCYEDRILATVDLSLLRRAVSNVVINAIIHNAPETEVTVSVALSNDISISVSDNGKGLTEEDIKNLFTRYYRGTNTEEKPQGSGLGLAIAKQIALLHNGSIEVHSVLGKGTDITIHLPNFQ